MFTVLDSALKHNYCIKYVWTSGCLINYGYTHLDHGFGKIVKISVYYFHRNCI